MMKMWEENFLHFNKTQEDPKVAKLKFLCWVSTLMLYDLVCRQKCCAMFIRVVIVTYSTECHVILPSLVATQRVQDNQCRLMMTSVSHTESSISMMNI